MYNIVLFIFYKDFINILENYIVMGRKKNLRNIVRFVSRGMFVFLINFCVSFYVFIVKFKGKNMRKNLIFENLCVILRFLRIKKVIIIAEVKKCLYFDSYEI